MEQNYFGKLDQNKITLKNHYAQMTLLFTYLAVSTSVQY